MGRLGQGANIGDRAEVAGCDDVRSRRVRVLGECLGQVLGGDSMSDALFRVDRRLHEGGLQPRQHEPVDDA